MYSIYLLHIHFVYYFHAWVLCSIFHYVHWQGSDKTHNWILNLEVLTLMLNKQIPCNCFFYFTSYFTFKNTHTEFHKIIFIWIFKMFLSFHSIGLLTFCFSREILHYIIKVRNFTWTDYLRKIFFCHLRQCAFFIFQFLKYFYIYSHCKILPKIYAQRYDYLSKMYMVKFQIAKIELCILVT